MKKFLRQVLLIVAASVTITACSSNKEKAVNKPVEQNNASQQQQQSEQTQETATIHKHNYEKARELLRDWIAIQLNAFDYKTADQARSDIPPGFVTIMNTSKDARKISTNNLQINIFSLDEVVESYNKYNRKTYSQKEVLEDVESIVSEAGRLTYKEVAEKSTDYDDEALKTLMKYTNTVVYFAGDKMYAHNIPMGVGGTAFPYPAEENEWTVDEDNSLIIPMKDYISKETVYIFKLKINDKQYDSGTVEKSFYYIADIVKK